MKKIKKVMIIAIFIFLVCATFAACSKHNKEQNKYTVYDVTFMLSKVAQKQEKLSSQPILNV